MASYNIDPPAVAQKTIGGIYSHWLGDYSPLDQQGNLNPRLAEVFEEQLQNIKTIDTKPILNTLQIVGITASIVLGILLVIALIKINQYWEQRIVTLRQAIQPIRAGEEALNGRWKEIRRHLVSSNDTEWRFAVIEADKIVDQALKQSGYPGETMGERMMLIDPGELRSLDSLWSAHKLRNIIAHNLDYKVRFAEAHEAIENYEKALRELGGRGKG